MLTTTCVPREVIVAPDAIEVSEDALAGTCVSEVGMCGPVEENRLPAWEGGESTRDSACGGRLR
jgi:hypothetical protein